MHALIIDCQSKIFTLYPTPSDFVFLGELDEEGRRIRAENFVGFSIRNLIELEKENPLLRGIGDMEVGVFIESLLEGQKSLMRGKSPDMPLDLCENIIPKYNANLKFSTLGKTERIKNKFLSFLGIGCAIEWCVDYIEKTGGAEKIGLMKLKNSSREKMLAQLLAKLKWEDRDKETLKTMMRYNFARTVSGHLINTTIVSDTRLERDKHDGSLPYPKRSGFVDISVCAALMATIVIAFTSFWGIWRDKYLERDTLLPCLEQYGSIPSGVADVFLDKYEKSKEYGEIPTRLRPLILNVFGENVIELETVGLPSPAKAENTQEGLLSREVGI